MPLSNLAGLWSEYRRDVATAEVRSEAAVKTQQVSSTTKMEFKKPSFRASISALRQISMGSPYVQLELV